MELLQVKSTLPLIITGAFGSGKTECALALAAAWARAGEAVSLVDLDFVNPYFRAQDHRAELEGLGVEIIAPEARVAAIDAPSVPAETRTALLHPRGRTIVDLGGDPAGAVVIAQFAAAMMQYDLWAAHNCFRPTTAEPAQAAALLAEIAATTQLRLSGLIAASHLGPHTTPDDILTGLGSTRATAGLLGVPVVLLSAPAWLPLPQLDLPVLAVTPRLKRPWE
ncbi:MAG: hypothetical protein ACYDCO_02100 [Armatimonadota bacterium]